MGIQLTALTVNVVIALNTGCDLIFNNVFRILKKKKPIFFSHFAESQFLFRAVNKFKPKIPVHFFCKAILHSDKNFLLNYNSFNGFSEKRILLNYLK